MDKFCTKCGAKLDEATKLCPNCDLAQKRKEPQISKSKKRSPFYVKLILCILLVLALSACVTGALMHFEIINFPFTGSENLESSEENINLTFKNGDCVFTPSQEHIQYDEENNVLYFNNQLIVYTFSDLSEDDANNLAKLVNGKIVGTISGSVNALQIQVEASTLDELHSMSEQIMEVSDVLYAGYDYPMQLLPTTNNSNLQDTTENISATTQNEEAGSAETPWWTEAIGADSAWKYSEKCHPIKIGIIDSGFDTEHEDLQGRITFLPEYMANSKDDHGTHVAGIIASNNNSFGIRGIADSASLVCIDWSPDDSINYLSTGEYIEMIKQLIEADAKVINNSWGTYFLSKDGYTQNLYGKDLGIKYLFEYLAVDSTGAYDSYVNYCEAFSKRSGLDCTIMMIELLLNNQDDFLIVQAAGNGEDNAGPGVDAQYASFFCSIDPETYNILSDSTRKTLSQKGIEYRTIDEHILIVGAVENNCDEQGYRMSQYSNFGPNVDICAPGGSGKNHSGENILSTLTDNSYGELSGTSMAAPMVTGSAGFIWSLNPELSAPEVRDILLTNTTVQAYGVGDGASYRYPMLNVGAAAEAVLSNTEENNTPDQTNQAEQTEPSTTDIVEFNGHQYYIYNLDTITTWEEAKQYCEEQGGYLATITSKEEDEFLYSYITDMGYDSALFGLSDTEQDNEWTWVTGETFAYENWASGEPNHQGGYEHYGMYYEKNKDGSWNDGSGKTCPFLCEWGDYQTDDESAAEIWENLIATGKYLEYTEGWEKFIGMPVSPTEYAILDIDGDGWEELILSGYQPDFPEFKYHSILVCEKESKEITEVSIEFLAQESNSLVGQSFGGLQYSAPYHALVYTELNNGSMFGGYNFMTLENNQLRMDFSVTFECNPDTNVISYSFNQDGNSTPISETEYNQYIIDESAPIEFSPIP